MKGVEVAALRFCLSLRQALCGDASRATEVYEYVAHVTQCFSLGLFAGRRFREEPPPTEAEIRAVVLNKAQHKRDLLAAIRRSAPSGDGGAEDRNVRQEAVSSAAPSKNDFFLPRNNHAGPSCRTGGPVCSLPVSKW